MRYAFLMALAVFILSSTILPSFRINDALPNFCIIISIVFLVLFSENHAYAFAIVYGGLQDIFLSRVIGIHMVSYLVIIYFLSKWIEVLFKGNFLTPAFLMVVSTMMYHLVYYLLAFFMQIALPLSILIERILTESLINTLLGVILYAIVFKKVNGYKLGDYNA
jgi:rod shape-determining protein MreD